MRRKASRRCDRAADGHPSAKADISRSARPQRSSKTRAVLPDLLSTC
jgi:hypothetical protein